MKNITERITIDDNLLDGKPTIRGMRITVQTILEFLSAGNTIEEILEQYPSLEKEDIFDCLKFAVQLVENFSVRKSDLKDLLKNVTKDNLHKEF